VSEDVSESDNSCHFYSVFCSVLQSARTGVGPRPDQTRPGRPIRGPEDRGATCCCTSGSKTIEKRREEI
jgi:hypothetical protein